MFSQYYYILLVLVINSFIGCVNNTYGPNCAYTCTCLNGATECSPVTGACNCTDGYTGLSCESGEESLSIDHVVYINLNHPGSCLY